MTAVMRAVARPTGARSLRAALVRGGKIVDERVIPPGEHLTVGPTERSTFVVTGLRTSVRLLEGSRAGYSLHLARGMRGRVAIGGEVADLAGAEARSPIPLDDEARGKIELGDAVVLFHFVEPFVAVARPQLPLSVKQGLLDGMDWKTTFIAAFSFLFHFGAVGAMYSDFTDATIVDDAVRVTIAIDGLRSIPMPPIEVPTNTTTATGEKPTKAEPDVKKPGGVATPRTGPRSGPESPGRREQPGDTFAHDLASELEQQGKAVLLALGTTGQGKTRSSIDNVLGVTNGLPLVQLEGAARDPHGTGQGATAGLTLGNGGGVVRPGERNVCIGCPPGGPPGDPLLNDVGTQKQVKKPVPGTTLTPPENPVGKVPGLTQVVAGLKPMLRACYKHELDDDPTAKGSVRVTATIGPNGDVGSVQTAASGLSSKMVSCVSRVVRGAPFSAPEGGGSAQVAIPMSFFPQ